MAGITWDDCCTTCQDLSSDTSATSLVIFKRMMNIGNNYILSDLGRASIEDTSELTTVADQVYYDLPMDCSFVKSVTIEIGDVNYVLQEEESQDIWNHLHQNSQSSDIPQLFFVRLNYGVGKSEIGIYPTPSTADYTITVVHEKLSQDLSNDAYATGTVTFTNGDETVTGSGTTFTAAMVGRYIKGNDGFWYRIATYTDATHVELDKKYEGTTASGVTTAIHEMFILPPEMQILPCYYALAHYYATKKDRSEEEKYWALFFNGLDNGRKRWGTKARSAIVRGNKMVSMFSPWANVNFPSSMT